MPQLFIKQFAWHSVAYSRSIRQQQVGCSVERQELESEINERRKNSKSFRSIRFNQRLPKKYINNHRGNIKEAISVITSFVWYPTRFGFQCLDRIPFLLFCRLKYFYCFGLHLTTFSDRFLVKRKFQLLRRVYFTAKSCTLIGTGKNIVFFFLRINPSSSSEEYSNQIYVGKKNQ